MESSKSLCLGSEKGKNVMADWTSLPSDLLRSISKLLDTRVDLLRFRAVCTTWRSTSVRPHPKIPYVILPMPFNIPERDYPEKYSHNYVLTEATVYSVQPLAQVQDSSTLPKGPITRSITKRMKDAMHPCIIKVEQLLSGNLRLIFPLSHVYLRHLDKQMPLVAAAYGNGFSDYSHHKLPQFFNLLDHRVVEMGKAYGFMPMNNICYSSVESDRIHKVVASSSFHNIGEGFAVMVVVEFGHLYVWKLGNEQWRLIKFRKGKERLFMFVDIIFHEGKFYALDFTGLLITIDIKTFQTTEVAPEIYSRDLIAADIVSPRRCQMYLVESDGDLLWFKNLVDCLQNWERGYDRVDVIIYKLDKKNQDWIRLERLEDRVFFLGDDAKFSCSTKDFDSNKGSCLYFKFRHRCVYNPEILGVVELQNGRLRNAKISMFNPRDFYFKMLYPPPPYLIK